MRQAAAVFTPVQKLHGGIELSRVLPFQLEGHCEAWNLYGAAAQQLLVMVVVRSFDLSFAACVVVAVAIVLRPCMAPVTDDTLYLCAARCVE